MDEQLRNDIVIIIKEEIAEQCHHYSDDISNINQQIQSIQTTNHLIAEKQLTHHTALNILTDSLHSIDLRPTISHLSASLYSLTTQCLQNTLNITTQITNQFNQLHANIRSIIQTHQLFKELADKNCQAANIHFKYLDTEITNIYGKFNNYHTLSDQQEFKALIMPQFQEIKSLIESFESGITKKVLASSLNYLSAKKTSPDLQNEISLLHHRIDTITIQEYPKKEESATKIADGAVYKLSIQKADKAEMLYGLDSKAGKAELEAMRYNCGCMQKGLFELTMVVSDLLKGSNRDADEFLKGKKRNALITATDSIYKKLKLLNESSPIHKTSDPLNMTQPLFNKYK